MASGTIKRLVRDRGFGFIRDDGGQEWFFHRSSVDGTLVLTGGAGVRAMSRAFDELFGISDAFIRTPMPGRTDAWILDDALTTHRIPRDDPRVSRFQEVYLRHLARSVEEPGPRKG